MSAVLTLHIPISHKHFAAAAASEMIESFTLRLLWMVLPPNASAFLTTKPPPLHPHTDHDFLATLSTPHPSRLVDLFKTGIRGPALAAAKRLNTVRIKYEMLCNHSSTHPMCPQLPHQLLCSIIHNQPPRVLIRYKPHQDPKPDGQPRKQKQAPPPPQMRRQRGQKGERKK